MSDTMCIICENDSEMEWWKCKTCIFGCHAHCIKTWVQKSMEGTCPHCRCAIEPRSVYTREDVFAVFCVLCLATLPSDHPAPSDITGID